MKLLTVTVPCYNSAEYMEKCVDSLLRGGDRVEVIIIDDGSKDNTGAIANKYAEKYPDIVRVIHQENGGHGEGINQGLIHATGKYFKVVDSDDVMSDDFTAFLDKLEWCEKNGGIDLMITNYYYQEQAGSGTAQDRYRARCRSRHGRKADWHSRCTSRRRQCRRQTLRICDHQGRGRKACKRFRHHG